MKELEKICRELSRRRYAGWHNFIIGKWSDSNDAEEAYRSFHMLMRKNRSLYPETYKKWFDTGEKTIPKRWQILKMAVALGFSLDETNEYLECGISEAEMQVNDYQEFIAMYCLYNGLGIKVYNEMTEFFEMNIDDDITLCNATHTEELRKAFDGIKSFSRDDFLVWMIKNQKMFKGYSITTYRYYVSLIDEVVDSFRKEAKVMLRLTLRETDFYEWAKNNGIAGEQYGTVIKQYVKNVSRRKGDTLPEDVVKNIMQYYIMAYSDKGRISIVLSEVYDRINDADSSKHIDGMPSFCSKYISELLNVSLHNEKQLRLSHTFRKMTGISDEEIKAKKKVRRMITMHKQRVRLVSRSELLILLAHTIQEKYTTEIFEKEEEYNREYITGRFTETADSMLTMCGMRKLDERYMVDAILLACFGEREMYQFADLLEIMRAEAED